MRRIDASERPMPEINPAKVCFVIEKSRELLSEDVGMAPDASNPTDDGERVILTDAAEFDPWRTGRIHPRPRCRRSGRPVALSWIGRGDYEADDWESAVKSAYDRREANVEVPHRHGPPSRLSAGRAFSLWPLMRGF